MSETIKFAWGTSSLGDFMVAMSATGVVGLEFSTTHVAMEESLRARFPEADVIHRPEELTDVVAIVAALIEDPGAGCELPLDLRGTSYEVKVWLLLREIAAGETTSYGALASKLGSRDAREVTGAIANNPVAVIVPCHRVIKKDGSISGYRWGVHRKRALLAREQQSAEH